MRAEILRRTPPQTTYHDAERTLVTEIGLHGPFYQVPEVLYFRRDPSWLWAAGHARKRTCRVKSKQDLVRTLDKHNKNRGLQFDAEMLLISRPASP